jgi:thiol:disulfide interchange protein DsbA
MKRLLLVISLAATLAGCTQKSPTEAAPSDPAVTAPPAEATTPGPAATPESSTPAAAPATSSAPVTSSAPGRPIPAKWKVDTNYRLIAPAQATNVDPGQVEIIEFLWLGCPHCYELNPYIEAWKQKLPAYVVFKQEHVTWDAQRLPHARLFYTLKALGAGDDLVVKAFDEIHRKNNILMAASANQTEQLQMSFAVANGLDGAAFRREYNGFAVNTSIKRADDLVRRYRIDQVPTLIVNGKYRTDVGMAGGPQQLTELLNDLAASEKGN